MEKGRPPLQVAVFGSGSGSNLEALLRAEGSYKVALVFTDRECRCRQIARTRGIPLISFFFKNFKGGREAYDREVLRLLRGESQRLGLAVDLVFLAGYMRLVTAPLLNAFPGRVLTVHPADLRNGRKYVGTDAVRQALEAGEGRTRSTVILVDEGMDTGPILTEGPWVEYSEGYPLTEEKVRRHQEKQKKESDWPAAIEAVKKIAKEAAACAVL